MGVSESPDQEEQLRRAVFSLLEECPVLPVHIPRKYGQQENNAVAIIAIPGEQRYLKRFISGAYEAQFPFTLRYNLAAGADTDRIDAEELLQNAADWMCGREVREKGTAYHLESYPSLTDGREIEKIEAGSVFPDKKQEDGTFAYQVTMNLIYTKKGSK